MGPAAEARSYVAGLIFCLTKGDLPLPVPPKLDWQANADTADEERGTAEVRWKKKCTPTSLSPSFLFVANAGRKVGPIRVMRDRSASTSALHVAHAPFSPLPCQGCQRYRYAARKSDRRRLRCSTDHLTRPSGRRIGSSEGAVVVISRSRISALNPTSQSYSRTSSTDSARSERNPATARRAAARSYKRGSFSREAPPQRRADPSLCRRRRAAGAGRRRS